MLYYLVLVALYNIDFISWVNIQIFKQLKKEGSPRLIGRVMKFSNLPAGTSRWFLPVWIYMLLLVRKRWRDKGHFWPQYLGPTIENKVGAHYSYSRNVLLRYLGDYIHNDWNTVSAEATVGDWYCWTLVGGMEIRQVIECCRSQQVGCLKAGMHPWETTHIPSLLNNCQTWVEISE